MALASADPRRVKRNILGKFLHSLTGKIVQFVKKLIYKVETAWESQEKYLGQLTSQLNW
jgi:predicted transcriptional regulator